ncbi:hypothetical protein [Alkalihalobacillus pseudalcaliphilus]|uniref:hypothetical protein n=1 Tax=Alkalihalobacillus pseudalcaliphilus TaxID=79884 RepID=UPI00064DB8F8|nr:hypothetical protein [Alkalihalobacillus pseudalcaliphilus]KMK77935.1 hypothetical protein AB990_00280 [Alkalihalobacillus pseudalcaliphilus]
MLKKLLFVIFSLFLMACTQEETFKSYDHAIQSVMEEHNIEPNQLILNIEELDKIIIFYYTGFDVIYSFEVINRNNDFYVENHQGGYRIPSSEVGFNYISYENENLALLIGKKFDESISLTLDKSDNTDIILLDNNFFYVDITEDRDTKVNLK